MGNLSRNIRIHQLDRRVKFWEYSTAQNESGAPEDTWTELAEVWAYVRGDNARERGENDKEMSFNQKSFVIRHGLTIDEKMKVEYEGKKYDILSIQQIENTRDRFLEIKAEYRE